MESRPKYESKPMSRPSSTCESGDSLEVNIGEIVTTFMEENE